MKNELVTSAIVLIILAAIGIYLYLPKEQIVSPSQLSADCITAGQTTPGLDLCCPKLVRIFVAYYTPTDSCSELSEKSVADGTVYYICSACGNKTCESWENRCNCPQDCRFP